MLTTVSLQNLSLAMVLFPACPSVHDLFLMWELPELGGTHWDTAKLGYIIREETLQMHLNKVEMGFGIDHVHTEVILLIPIVFEALVPLGQSHSHVAQGLLMS